ncbi:MAG: DMT family transporter [Minisyncoccia bacterium]
MKKQNSVLLGLTGVLLVWLSSGIGFPLVSYLDFGIGELLASRGLMTLLIPLIVLGGAMTLKTSAKSYKAALWLTVCAATVFWAFKIWSVSLTLVVYTTAPIFSFILAWRKGRRPELVPVLSLALILLGVFFVLKPWTETEFSLLGFVLALIGAFTSAKFAEAVDESGDSMLQKCFAMGVIMLMAGLIGFEADWASIVTSPKALLVLLGFGALVGFVNLFANVVAIKNLTPTIYQTIVQGETPAAILFAGLILGEKLDTFQWWGVAVAIGGVIWLSQWLGRKDKPVAIS